MTNPEPQLSNLLKWGIENSTATEHSSSATATDGALPSRALDPSALSALFGGPSDADLMKSSMSAILSPHLALEDRLIAFDNFEQLIESIDNANNLAPLELWTPLIRLLVSEEPELARMAAWCVGTAVQNNPKAQERALVGGALERLAGLVMEEEEEEANGEERKLLKRKACYAISSEVRNFQPGMDALLKALGGEYEKKRVDAADMDAVDELMELLRA